MTTRSESAIDTRDRRPAGGLRSDSVIASVLLLIGMTLLQRLVGLARNVWFCRTLADDQLGRWSLTYSFLLFMAPLLVLGLPGSFGRYVERYRQREQLRPFLVRTALASFGVMLIGCLLLRTWPERVATLLFGDTAQAPLVRLLAMVLGSVIVFNFLTELLTALRLIRFVSVMQVTCSVMFAVLGISLLHATSLREEAALLAYGGATLTASVLGLAVILRYCRSLPTGHAPFGHRDFWTTLLPFAGWVWAGNIVSSLFEVADQFMLKYFTGLPAQSADALVGQYYSSRIIPLLMISLAALLAGTVLPHLTADWESDRRQHVARRMNSFLKISILGFTVGSAGLLVAAPLMFDWVLGGRYEAGARMLPGTLTYCVWYGIALMAMNYLFCAEKARLGILALAIGLLVNCLLNYVLAPRFGLPGVVAATMTANAVALALILHFGSLVGIRWNRSLWTIIALPLSLLLGGWPALAIVLLVCAVAWHEGWLLTSQERDQFRDLLAHLLRNIRRGPSPREPASA